MLSCLRTRITVSEGGVARITGVVVVRAVAAAAPITSRMGGVASHASMDGLCRACPVMCDERYRGLSASTPGFRNASCVARPINFPQHQQAAKARFAKWWGAQKVFRRKQRARPEPFRRCCWAQQRQGISGSGEVFWYWQVCDRDSQNCEDLSRCLACGHFTCVEHRNPLGQCIHCLFVLA